MNLETVKKNLSTKLDPTPNFTTKNKLASVLIVIYDDEPKILMTVKPMTMSFHGGEVSFPGGKMNENDPNLLFTALRETKEEINLDIKSEQVIGQLSPVTTLNSGFRITPFLSVLDELPSLSPNSEVESILKIPLGSFLETLNNDTNPEHQSIQEMYTFQFQDKMVWGASARMLKQIDYILSKNHIS